MFKDKIKDNNGSFLINILIGTGTGILATFIVLLIMAAVSVFLDLQSSLMSPLASVSLAVGAYIGAYISARLNKEKGLINGLISSGIIFIILTVISAILSADGVTLISLLHFVITMLSGVIGGIIGINSVNKRKIV